MAETPASSPQNSQNPKHWWDIANSPLVVALLAGSILTVVAGALMVQHYAFRQLWNLDRELDYRLLTYKNRLTSIQSELEPLVKAERESKAPEGLRSAKAIRESLLRAYNELETPAHPAYPECRDLGLYGLLAQAELASQHRFDDRLPGYSSAR
jgi:hypothetical protein